MAWNGKCLSCGRIHTVLYGTSVRCCGAKHEMRDCPAPTIMDVKLEAERERPVSGLIGLTWGGFDIHEVEPGTEIEGPDGEKLTVTASEAVTKGRHIYCTSRIVNELRKRSRKNSTNLF